MVMEADLLLWDLWPFSLSIGAALFVLSFLIPDPAAVTIVRVLSFAVLICAVIVSFPIV